MERRLLRAKKRSVSRVTSKKEFAERAMPKRAKSQSAKEQPFQFSSGKEDKSAPFRYEKKHTSPVAAPPEPEPVLPDLSASEPANAFEEEEKADFETTLARVAQLSRGMLQASEKTAGDPAKRFRFELRSGLSSLDAALGRQREALERLRANTRDAGRFRDNNAAMQWRAEEAESEARRKGGRAEEAKRESETLGWAAEQLDRLEQLTPKLEKAAGRGKANAAPAAPAPELRRVVDASQSKEQLLARLEELSTRIKLVVDQL